MSKNRSFFPQIFSKNVCKTHDTGANESGHKPTKKAAMLTQMNFANFMSKKARCHGEIRENLQEKLWQQMTWILFQNAAN